MVSRMPRRRRLLEQVVKVVVDGSGGLFRGTQAQDDRWTLRVGEAEEQFRFHIGVAVRRDVAGFLGRADEVGEKLVEAGQPVDVEGSQGGVRKHADEVRDADEPFATAPSQPLAISHWTCSPYAS